MKLGSVVKILFFLGLVIAFTACGKPMMGASDGSSSLRAGQLPIVYYPQNCGTADSSNKTFWCENPPSSTTTGTGTTK
jgi:hypothetical protein